MFSFRLALCLSLVGVCAGLAFTDDRVSESSAPSAVAQPYHYQYEFGEQKLPAATAEEPKRGMLSVTAAANYLDKGARIWSDSRKCVSCHTNGTYMQIRPSLTIQLGAPAADQREFFVDALQTLQRTDREMLKQSTRPAQAIYLAAGLAEWDAHVSKLLSPETEQALALMLEIQLESGTWGSLDRWPPFESDAYHEATVAAMAIGTAPGWLANLKDEKLTAGVGRLKNYLKTQPPPHDYGRVLLLWASSRMPDLVADAQKQQLIDMVFKHQRDDGGWSIRSFAAPEAWGSGYRAKKLRDEPEFASLPSDGHQTGLALIVLRSAGIAATDPRIQKGVQWLVTNQRESGRWWTRSLNTDAKHFITYSGTAYPLLALSLCDALPSKTVTELAP